MGTPVSAQQTYIDTTVQLDGPADKREVVLRIPW